MEKSRIMKNSCFTLIVITLLCLFSFDAYPQSVTSKSLVFNPEAYQVQTLSLNGKSFRVRAYEDIVYVANPVDTVYEKMNIYIPVEYFEGGSINGFNAATAPIFFPNKVGGYMPAKPATAIPKPGGDFPGGMPSGIKPPKGDKMPPNMPPMGGPMGGNQQSAVLVALSHGYVVASAGARGRTTKDKTGAYTGKAPTGIVDLKAAIRYLKFNDQVMPGDANKIISNGTSAGGAMSTLLGATGNNPDYEPYLRALGAATATDDIFAVSAYCPITNLDHADMAYEWQFYGVNTYRRQGFPPGANQDRNDKGAKLTDEQITVSKELKELFPDYVNSLKLTDKEGKALTLDKEGNGSFKTWVGSFVLASAQKAVNAGKDLSSLTWLKVTAGKVTDLDFEAFVRYMERQKTPPAFDALDLSTAENQLFGTEKVDKQHFTEYSATKSKQSSVIADTFLVKMMNPMNYIGQPQTNTAKHWRIRHGTKDKDTGLSIPVILATCLQNNGYDVDFELPWEKPHSGDYDLDELFQWADHICK